MNKTRITIIASALLGMFSQASADTTTGNFQVGATLNASCAIAVEDINFGVLVAKFDVATANIIYTCSNGLVAEVRMSDGRSGDYTQRKMFNEAGTDSLNYNVYTSNSGPTYSPPTKYKPTLTLNSPYDSITGTGVQSTKTMYARLESDPIAATPGNYSDSLTVTFYY